jgi:predicted Zn-dependent peptidase
MSHPVRSTTLDSGVVVVTERMDDVRSVAAGIFVGVGSRDEAPEQAGCSHFLEHLLFKGTADRGAQEISEMIDGVGGEMNAYTTKEYTAYYVRTLDTDAPMGLGLLCDIISLPALRADEVEVERQVILEEIAQRADEPGDYVHDLAHEARFPKHPLGVDTAGSPETVAATSRDDIRAFMDATYTGDAIVVAVAGHTDHDAVVAQVTAQLHRPMTQRPLGRVAPAHGPERLRVDELDTEQAHAVLALTGLTRDDSDRFAFGVLDHVVGGGMSSRLFSEIREKRGLAYSVYSYRVPFADAGFWGIYTGTAPQRLTEVLDVLHAELQRLAADGITDAELTRAKSSIRGATALGLEDSGARMSRIGRTKLLTGEVPEIDHLLAKTDAVTSADIRQVVERVLSGQRTLAIAGPVAASAVTGHPVLG